MLIHEFCKICEHEIVLQEGKSKQKQFQVHKSYKTCETNWRITLEKMKKIWICLVSNATWEKFWPNCELWWRDEVDLLLALFSCKFPLESASVPCSFSGRAAEKLRLWLRTGTNVIKHPLLIDICLDLTHLLAWWPIKNVFIISCKKNHSVNSSKLENCHHL